ncbi:hypothetical protein NMG60_11001684 [Bertholletia excelsa]
MEEQDDDGRQSRSRRTRSQVAPDWTSVECLTLVNEIAATERDCQKTFSSFQKWKIIVENCNALDVNRTLNQCRRKWDSLLTDYKKVKLWESSSSESFWSLEIDRRKESGLPEDFDYEVFKAIDDHLKAEEDSETEPDIDPEAVDGFDLVADSGITGFKKHKSQVMRQKCSVEESLKPKKRNRDKMTIPKESHVEEKVKPPKPRKENDILGGNGSIEEKEQLMEEQENVLIGNANMEEQEQIMVEKLRENAELIIAIIEGKVGESEDYVLANLKNAKTSQIDFTRRQADNLIACLGNLSDTLSQLCDLVQHGNGA